MNLNFIFFPVPKKRYTVQQHQGELIWIPKLEYEERASHHLRTNKRSFSQTIQGTCTNKNNLSILLNKENKMENPYYSHADNSHKTNNLNETSRLEGKLILRNQMRKNGRSEQSISNLNFGSVLQTRAAFNSQPFKKEDGLDKNALVDGETLPTNSNFSSPCQEFEEQYYKIMEQIDDDDEEEVNPFDINTMNTQNNHSNFKSISANKSASSSLLISKGQNYQMQSVSNKAVFSTNQKQNTHSLPFQGRRANIKQINQQQQSSGSTSAFPRKFHQRQKKSTMDTSFQSFSMMVESIDENIPQNITNVCSPRHIENYSNYNFKSSDISYKKSKLPNQITNPLTTSLKNNPIQNKEAFLLHQKSKQNITLTMFQSSEQNKQLNISQMNEQKQQSQTSQLFYKSSEQNHLFSFPYQFARDEQQTHIPSLFLKSSIPTNYIIVYFHGNGEDISLSYELIDHLRKNLCVNVLAMEYQGYGLYEGSTDESQILKDTQYVFQYLTKILNFQDNHIIIMGRSIGTGPATWLAANQNVGALILISAFTSLRAVVKHVAGSLAQHLIKERFVNLDNIQKVVCPTFIVHGQMDSLIPFTQSQSLHDSCKGPCQLILPRKMTHTEFNFTKDLTTPLREFLIKNKIEIHPQSQQNRECGNINLPHYLFHPRSQIIN